MGPDQLPTTFSIGRCVLSETTHCGASASACCPHTTTHGLCLSCRCNVWPPPEMPADAFGPLEAAWPLYYESDRRTRFAYAIFALNKVS